MKRRPSAHRPTNTSSSRVVAVMWLLAKPLAALTLISVGLGCPRWMPEPSCDGVICPEGYRCEEASGLCLRHHDVVLVTDASESTDAATSTDAVPSTDAASSADAPPSTDATPSTDAAVVDVAEADAARDAASLSVDAAGACVDTDGDGYGVGCLAGLDCDDSDPNYGLGSLCDDGDNQSHWDVCSGGRCRGLIADHERCPEDCGSWSGDPSICCGFDCNDGDCPRCPPDSSCSYYCEGETHCDLNCDPGSSCYMLATGTDNTALLTCDAASCVLFCIDSPDCVLDCFPGASCLLSFDSTSTATLQCDGGDPVECSPQLWACNRDCL